jgi:hypothetical protein
MTAPGQPRVTLAMLMAHQKQLMVEIRAMRDEILVQGARLDRVDRSLRGLIEEVWCGHPHRAGTHRIQARTTTRVRDLEERLLPSGEEPAP